MLWKMLDQLQIHARNCDRVDFENIDKGSIGYAIEELLKDFTPETPHKSEGRVGISGGKHGRGGGGLHEKER